MQRPLLIVNPFASSVSDQRVAAVSECSETSRFGGRSIPAMRPSSRGRPRRPALYVFSGDGGYNEALNGLDADVPVGFIPGGGANVLPRALGLPRDPIAAARRVRAGRTRRISLGRVNGRRFAFAAGIGLSAEIVRRVDRRGRTEEAGRAGNAMFAWTVVQVVAQRRGRFEPALEIAGRGRAAFALVANCDPFTYAGPVPVHVAPEARFELGLDLCAPRTVTPLTIPRLLGYFGTGRGHSRARDLIYEHDLDQIEIRCDEALPLQVDGEDLGDVDAAQFECEREVLRVLV